LRSEIRGKGIIWLNITCALKKTPDEFSRRKFIKATAGGIIGAGMLRCAIPQLAYAVDGSPEKNMSFRDSLGRYVDIPEVVDGVVPYGRYAQTLLLTLAPASMASLATYVDNNDLGDYQKAELDVVEELQKTGLIGDTPDNKISNMRTIKRLRPSLIIDAGIPNDTRAQVLDEVQQATGIPTVFIDISFGNLSEAYRTIGTLLAQSERGTVLADYVDGTYGSIEEKMPFVETSPRVYYAAKQHGIAYRGEMSMQNQAISFLGATPVMIPSDVTGKYVDLSASNNVEMDYVLFDSHECFSGVTDRSGEDFRIWGSRFESSETHLGVAPTLLHSWIGSPIFLQAIGILWIGNFIWPNVFDYDLLERTREFYSLFYNYEITDNEAAKLLGLADSPESE
jgi:iron complex transport system substrate-binding protein